MRNLTADEPERRRRHVGLPVLVLVVMVLAFGWKLWPQGTAFKVPLEHSVSRLDGDTRKVWDFEGGTEAEWVALHPDGDRVLRAKGTELALWDMNRRKALWVRKGKHAFKLWGFSPGGTFFALWNQGLDLHRTDDGGLVAHLGPTVDDSLLRVGPPSFNVIFSDDERWLAINTGREVKLYSLAPLAKLGWLQRKMLDLRNPTLLHPAYEFHPWLPEGTQNRPGSDIRSVSTMADGTLVLSTNWAFTQ